MLRPIPFVIGFLIPLALMGVFLLWEWSCDESMGGWASGYSECNFWTRTPTYKPYES
jgi:hypothetical protein